MKISAQTSVNWQFPLCSNGNIQYVSLSPYLQISTLSNGSSKWSLKISLFVSLLLVSYRSLIKHDSRQSNLQEPNRYKKEAEQSNNTHSIKTLNNDQFCVKFRCQNESFSRNDNVRTTLTDQSMYNVLNPNDCIT